MAYFLSYYMNPKMGSSIGPAFGDGNVSRDLAVFLNEINLSGTFCNAMDKC